MAARTRIKMCGCTSADDALLAVEAGADAVGVIFAPSVRRIALAQARAVADVLPPYVSLVGVFVDPPADELIAATSAIPRMHVQFSGRETPAFCDLAAAPYVKVFHVGDDGWDSRVDDYRGIAMLETASGGGGGSGRTFAWERALAIARRRPVIISGGLTPENVAGCVREVRPFGVDVRSGIETQSMKDRTKMHAFVRAVREADASA